MSTNEPHPNLPDASQPSASAFDAVKPKPVVGCFDVACRKCRRRYGWTGTLRDQPRCPSCQASPDAETMKHDAAMIEEFRELLGKKADEYVPSEWLKMRKLSGLTLGQAAKLLFINPDELRMIESGQVKPSDLDLLKRMASLYAGK